MIIYSIVFILLLFLTLRYWKAFHLQDLSNWTIPVAFLLKFGVGLALILIHIKTYGVDELSHDGETFLREGKLLNNVFYQSIPDFFRLLTGIGETEALIQKYLYMTEYWDAGDLTIINDSKNVIRVHSIIHFFSGNSLFIHLALMCLISTIALRNVYLSFVNFIDQPRLFIFWFLLLVPSTIFWTSSILKEPFMFLGMSFVTRALLANESINRKVLYALIAAALLLLFKPYILVCTILALTAVLAYKYIFKSKVAISIIGLLMITFVTGFFLDKPRERVVHYLSRKQFDFVNVGKGGVHVLADTCFYYFQPHQYRNLYIEGNKVVLLKETDSYIIKFGSIDKPIPVHLKPEGKIWTSVYNAPGCASYIETTPINDSPEQLIKNIPEALVNSILRPFPGDPGSRLKFMSVMETWLLLLFLLFAFIRHRTIGNREKSIIFGLSVFALSLFLLIGWTTPVLGAIARYRFPAQLALVIIGLIILKPLNFLKWKNTSS